MVRRIDPFSALKINCPGGAASADGRQGRPFLAGQFDNTKGRAAAAPMLASDLPRPEGSGSYASDHCGSRGPSRPFLPPGTTGHASFSSSWDAGRPIAQRCTDGYIPLGVHAPGSRFSGRAGRAQLGLPQVCAASSPRPHISHADVNPAMPEFMRDLLPRCVIGFLTGHAAASYGRGIMAGQLLVAFAGVGRP